MKDNDLQRAAASIHDDLLEIARMFADSEHFKAAIQVQGFARLVIDEAAAIQQETQIKKPQGVRLAS